MDSDVTPDGSDVDGSAAPRVDLATLLRGDTRLGSNLRDHHNHADNPFQPLSPAALAASDRAVLSSDSAKSVADYRSESLRLFVGTWNMCAPT